MLTTMLLLYLVVGQQTEVSYLQDAVSRLQTAIFDCCTSRKDVLHQDWPWPVDRGIPGYHSEAQTLRTCGNKAACVMLCIRGIEPQPLQTRLNYEFFFLFNLSQFNFSFLSPTPLATEVSLSPPLLSS